MLKELLNCKSVSIYCIINEQDRKIYITYSIETLPSVLHNINKFKKELYEDRNKVEFKVIETYDSKGTIYLKWRVQELYQEYKELGYTFYTAYKPLQWKMYVGIGTGRGDNVGCNYKAIVKLRTSINNVYEVIRFDTLEEANLFVQSSTISTAVRLL